MSRVRKFSVYSIVTVALTTALFAGCGHSPSSKSEDRPVASAEGQKWLLKEEPSGAKNVTEVRASAGDAQDVVVVGRIGGSQSPLTKSLAAFLIVDVVAKPCNELPGDTCATPWDYCCEADLPGKTLPVRVYDDKGEIMATDARTLLGLKELDTVVIRGKTKRDASKNIEIVAEGVFVKR